MLLSLYVLIRALALSRVPHSLVPLEIRYHALRYGSWLYSVSEPTTAAKTGAVYVPWDVVTPLPAGASLLVPREIRYHALHNLLS